MDEQQEINDAALIQAIRRRMLDEIQKKSDAERIVNNIYAGDVGGPRGGGLMDRMGGPSESEPDDSSYFVDILRENYEPGDEAMITDPVTGEKVPKKLERGGWGKYVHRFSQPKKKVMAPEGME